MGGSIFHGDSHGDYSTRWRFALNKPLSNPFLQELKFSINTLGFSILQIEPCCLPYPREHQFCTAGLLYYSCPIYILFGRVICVSL